MKKTDAAIALVMPSLASAQSANRAHQPMAPGMHDEYEGQPSHRDSTHLQPRKEHWPHGPQRRRVTAIVVYVPANRLGQRAVLRGLRDHAAFAPCLGVAVRATRSRYQQTDAAESDVNSGQWRRDAPSLRRLPYTIPRAPRKSSAKPNDFVSRNRKLASNSMSTVISRGVKP